MLDRLGDYQQALGYYHRAHAILVDDVEADPGNLWRGAREMYEKSVAIWSDTAARGMLTESDDAEAAAVLKSLSDAEARLRTLSAGS